MNRQFLPSLCLATTLLGLAGASCAHAAQPTKPTDTAAIEKILADAEANGLSGAIDVVKGGQTFFKTGIGLADRENKVKATADTIFCIGSITKSFTAEGILKLEQQGKLKVEDKISNFFPNLPPDKAGITIHQLLTHSAGLGEYIDRPGEGGDFADISKVEALKRVFEEKLKFEPGTRSEYSNNGYTVLAAIIEKVSGDTYEKFIRSNIFEPAGMARSGFYGEKLAPPSEFAIGYGRKKKGEINSPLFWPSTTWALKGAGGVVSCPTDMAKWIEALQDGKILQGEELKKAFAGQVAEGEGPGMEGYGWIVGKTRSGIPLINVGGGNNFGFHSALFIFPTTRNLICFNSNSGTPDVQRDAVMGIGRELMKP